MEKDFKMKKAALILATVATLAAVAAAPAEARGLAEPDAATGGAGAAGAPSTSSSLPAEIVPSPVMFTDAATGLDTAVSLSGVPPVLATVVVNAGGTCPPGAGRIRIARP